MSSGCGRPHGGSTPSSARQLPILAALHARSPTLFAHIIHDGKKKVNGFFLIFWKNAPGFRKNPQMPLKFVQFDEKLSEMP